MVPSCTAAGRSATCAPAPSTRPRSPGLATRRSTVAVEQPSRRRRRRLAQLRDGLSEAVRTRGAGRRPERRHRPGRRIAGHRAPVSFPGCEGDSLLSCSTRWASSAPPARLLGRRRRALPRAARHGRPAEVAGGSLRFSLGHTSTEADVDALARRDRPGCRARPGRRPRQRRRGALTVRVLAAMSGGVDSAVAAARMRRRRPRRRRRPPRAVAQPAVVPQRRPRLLHDRGRARRPPRRRRRSASRSTSGTWPSGSAPTSSTTSSPSTPPAARPTRACAATRRSSSPAVLDRASRSASTRSHRALRAGRGWAGRARAAPRGRPGQGPVVRARRPHRRTARRADVPARRQPQGRGPGGGARRGPGRGAQARQPRHLLHRRRRHRRVPA